MGPASREASDILLLRYARMTMTLLHPRETLTCNNLPPLSRLTLLP